MLTEMSDLLRQFEQHCGVCTKCAAYYSVPIQFDVREGACAIGSGLILRMLKLILAKSV